MDAKLLSKYVQDRSVKVVPDGKSLLLEDDVLHVPDYRTLKHLESKSMSAGLEDSDVYRYAKSAVNLAGSLGPGEPLKVFSDSLEERKTVSDRIIDYVKKKQGSADRIEQDTAMEFCYLSYERLFKDLTKTRKMCEEYLV